MAFAGLVAGALPAVDVQDCAGDETCRFEVKHGRDDGSGTDMLARLLLLTVTARSWPIDRFNHSLIYSCFYMSVN